MGYLERFLEFLVVGLVEVSGFSRWATRLVKALESRGLDHSGTPTILWRTS